LRTIFKWFFRAAALALLLSAALFAVAYFYPEKILCVDSGPVTADVLIVLGGGNHERAPRAAALFKAGVAPRIILSGEGDDEINRLALLRAGVPAAAIEVESKSMTTHENAEFTLKLLRAEKVRRAILVTSWYHSRRALKTFEHEAGAEKIVFSSRPTYYGFEREEWRRLGVGKHMWLEFLKLPGYWIRYGVNPF
jgi:uncharacterized SAM-binding protein YcdF (DUF218 family)